MKSFSEARALIGGLKGVMTRLGDNPQHEHKWKVMPTCPFCGHKDSSGVFNKGSGDFFKCHHTGCSSGGAVVSEVGYIALKEGLSETVPVEGGASPAYRRFLELAGCWEEPSDKPKQSPAPAPKKVTSPAAPASEPVLPNPVLPPAPPDTQTLPLALPEEGDDGKDDAATLLKCIEVIRFENRASVSILQKRLRIGYKRATRLMNELETQGVVGPAKGSDPRDIIKLPPPAPGMITIKIGDELHVEPVAAPVAPTDPAKANVPAKPEEKPKLPLGLAALRAFFEKLTPTENEMRPYLPGGPVPDLIPYEVAKKLKFRPVSLFEKRGLTSVTCEVLGLRGNPPENDAVLQEIQQQHPWEEIRSSGLWLESDKKRKLGRRPNAQFAGKGQVGRKPVDERKGKDDKWVWGMCQPTLIPYFDESGDLVKLRPHKGGAPSGTIAGRPRIYVPRAYKSCADIVERFYEVIICEGEYKAMAIWQTLGMGAKLQVDAAGQPLAGIHQDTNFEPIGVCALPGISYVTNVEMRMDLERWLADVGARRVIVAFDDEDKMDKPFAQRFDAQRDARVLAIELSKTLHVDARVCVLPREWRNSKGKADWDGALVKITNEKK